MMKVEKLLGCRCSPFFEFQEAAGGGQVTSILLGGRVGVLPP